MITVVTSVTNEELYNQYLLPGLQYQDVPYKLILTNSSLTIWEAYNSIGTLDTEYVAFIAQDIRLIEKGFLRKAEELCNTLPDLGLAGIVGWTEEIRDPKGYWIYNHPKGNYNKKIEVEGNYYLGTWRGEPFKEPIEVQVVDSMIMIIPKKIWDEVKFDSESFSFHCGAFDYCLALKYKLGKKIYLLPLLMQEDCSTTFTPEYLKKHGNEQEGIKAIRTKWSSYIRKIAGRGL